MAYIMVSNTSRGVKVDCKGEQPTIIFAGVFENTGVVLTGERLEELEFYFGNTGQTLTQSSIIKKISSTYGLCIVTRCGRELKLPPNGHFPAIFQGKPTRVFNKNDSKIQELIKGI
jgi:hypothetical protein